MQPGGGAGLAHSRCGPEPAQRHQRHEWACLAENIDSGTTVVHGPGLGWAKPDWAWVPCKCAALGQGFRINKNRSGASYRPRSGQQRLSMFPACML